MKLSLPAQQNDSNTYWLKKKNVKHETLKHTDNPQQVC